MRDSERKKECKVCAPFISLYQTIYESMPIDCHLHKNSSIYSLGSAHWCKKPRQQSEGSWKGQLKAWMSQAFSSCRFTHIIHLNLIHACKSLMAGVCIRRYDLRYLNIWSKIERYTHTQDMHLQNKKSNRFLVHVGRVHWPANCSKLWSCWISTWLDHIIT